MSPTFNLQLSTFNFHSMAVQNHIVKVQKRNRALVRVDPERILRAMLRAAESIGGFQNTADAYACYRWGRHWLREGASLPSVSSATGSPRRRWTKRLPGTASAAATPSPA